MSDKDDNDDVQKFVDALDKTLEERLPDGELATKEDVEEMVDDRLKAQEDSPTDGTPERPSGEDSSPTETDAQYSGDNPDNTTTDSDKVEEKTDSYSMEELKSILPDDQFKAIEPLLSEKREGLDEDYDGVPDAVEEDGPEEEVAPPEADALTEEAGGDPFGPEDDDDEQEVMAAKSASGLDWNRLTDQQKVALVKSGALNKSDSDVRTPAGVGADVDPAHAGDDVVKAGDRVMKADNESVARDPAMRKIYDDEGNPQI